MRKYILLLSFFAALFFAPATSHAGFLVKRKAAPTETVAPAATNNELTAKQERRQEIYNTLMRVLRHDDGEHKDHRCHNCNGWQGTASMWCAIGGFFYFPPALILALVWGALGMKPGAPHRKRAIAGVVISIIGIFFWAFFITLMIWSV